MKTIITGGKSSSALKLLKAFPGNTVLFADYGEMPAFLSANYQFIGLGDRNDETIAHNLLNSCLDHEVQQLIPLYAFELEAVAKSAVLFQEFNIKVLLPEMHSISDYLITATANSQNWVIYEDGKLIYSSNPELPESADVNLNGVYYVDKTPEGTKYILYTIS